MTFDSITNRGEFFSNHYLDAVIAGDLGDLRRRWDEHEAAHKATARSRIRGLAKDFFPARANASEASHATTDEACRALNQVVLEALGFTVDRQVLELPHTTEDQLHVPVAATVETGSGLLLVALDAGLADDVDDIFDSSADTSANLVDPAHKAGDKVELRQPADAIAQIFATDDPPRWVAVVAGRIVLLAERSKWAEGRFLAIDLDAALERNDTKKAGELETIAALFSTDALVPDDGKSVIDELSDASYKHAVGVSKELREGIRHSIEILANEVIEQRFAKTAQQHRTRFAGDEVDPRQLTTQCLRYLYRLLVLLYAESRPELGIVPVNDDVYLAGYSLDRLRELVLVDLDTDDARNGSHLDQSLTSLFELVNHGYHAEHAAQAFVFDTETVDPEVSYEDYLQFPGLDAQLFDPSATSLLDGVTLRNESLQQVLRLLMLSPEGKGKKSDRGFISYAQLGINQLGALYEGLMAYTGFFAKEDLHEVAKGGDPSDGTWVVPVTKADEYDAEVFVTRTDPLTGKEERILHPTGSFVFRLSGRDRQRSASYYTPEVLTRCVVKHALAELLGMDDYAPEHGSSGITEAREILDLTICEPALGSGAFANEAINQLSAVYLQRRQADLGETLDPERYNRELQKVKAHFALHQTYGVDLNATAVELAEVSLWLNCMHPGLKAPWFGLQLRRGNSLVGCRRATWRTSQLKGKPWSQTKKDDLQPPLDRPLSESLNADEIHHFLLPAHGWAAVADRGEAKEFRTDRAKGLKEWRKTILAAPSPNDGARLTTLAAGVERLWAAATERIRLVQQDLRRPIEVWGADPLTAKPPVSREKAIEALENPETALGRLRTVMDAWIGLWFWELDADVVLPTWSQWLTVLEALVDPEVAVGPTGQLDMFDDLAALLEADERRSDGRVTVAELREQHPWLAVAVDLARREGAWHWELEFAPRFANGGFDLQVGNPPWVVWAWNASLAVAEIDPRVMLEDEATAGLASLTAADLTTTLGELASHTGTQQFLNAHSYFPGSSGGQSNVYQSFLETCISRLSGPRSVVGLMHPAGFLSDKDSSALRVTLISRFRRVFKFVNQLKLFEDVGNAMPYSISVSTKNSNTAPAFIMVSNLLHPSALDESIAMGPVAVGTGETLPQKWPDGEWVVQGSPGRVVLVDDRVLESWSRMAAPDPDSQDLRLLSLHSESEAEALNQLAAFPNRLSGLALGTHEGASDQELVKSGQIKSGPERSNLERAILLSPNIGLLNPLEQESNEKAKTHRDYRLIDLEGEPHPLYRFVMTPGAEQSDRFRVCYKRWIDPKGERVMQVAILPPGTIHLGPISEIRVSSALDLVTGMLASLPLDYLCRVQDRSNLYWDALERLPMPDENHRLRSALGIRTARLNCLTADYSRLWEEFYNPTWARDSWTLPHPTVTLGDVGPKWTMDAPLRRDVDRRHALVEIDALAALMLGLTAEQLCSMYRTQFPVLRKYEYAMVFDAEGHKICAHHHSAGYRQGNLQQQAKDGDLPPEWTSVWKMFEQWEDDPGAVDWRGRFHPPFYRPDREAEMTTAYSEFKRRLDAGEYGIPS